jgi:uncharacterized protein (TIGR02001 family)
LKKHFIGALVLSSAIASVSAQTEPAVPAASPLTGNMTIASQYVFRGLSQTNGKPAIQGGLDYTHASGLYVGTWLSNISWYTDQNAGVKSAPQALSAPTAAQGPLYTTGQFNQANLEWDIYGGYKNTFANDWTYDVGLIRYQYPGTYNNTGAYRVPNTTEAYGAIGYKWLTLKYSKAISTYTFGVNESRGASYLDLSAQIPLGESGYNLQAHVGHQRYPGNANVGYWGASGGNNGYFSYTDYKLGLTKDYAGFTFGLAWSYANTRDTAPDGDTTTYMNAFGKNIGRDRVVVSASKSF